MRLLSAALACAFTLFAAGVMAEAGGVTSASRSSASTGIGAGVGGSSVRESASSSTEIGPRGTKAGELEKAAGKSAPESANGEQSVARQAGHYFLSRWYDLIDIVDFSIGAGPGLMVNAHATKLAQIGGGWMDAYHVGFRGRSAGLWREKRKEVGVSLLYYQRVERERITGWVESFRTEKMDLDTSAVYANSKDRAFLGVGATVQAGVMVNANIRPMQALDFVLGWMTIDILDDDTGNPKRNKDL
ncbi:MAG: hypothetical protein NTW87_20620 [Planctomycetota bacterium]|nr:hypothetical protein [Planctomycetota bacterium]